MELMNHAFEITSVLIDQQQKKSVRSSQEKMSSVELRSYVSGTIFRVYEDNKN